MYKLSSLRKIDIPFIEIKSLKYSIIIAYQVHDMYLLCYYCVSHKTLLLKLT